MNDNHIWAQHLSLGIWGIDVCVSFCDQVDDNIGLLVSELKRKNLWGRINVLITSDHGMAQCSADRLIRLDSCLHPDNYTLVDLSPVTAILPKTSKLT